MIGPVSSSLDPRLAALAPAKAQSDSAPVSFEKMLLASIEETSQLSQTAERNIESRLLGENITSAEVYTSLKKAEMALNMMIQVRNKLFTAYQEIQQMRM
ncbi:MAG: flagellar hook-basal body complex protein FliE [Planctomycetaceae bacterium]|nr:flagellar hook-basal body complex protein FliE [Planctomycetaceae bacterium]